MKVDLKKLEKELNVEFPEEIREEIKAALKFYREIHWGEEAKKIKTVEVPDPPKTGVKVGDLIFLGYVTRKGRKENLFVHVFKAPFPILLTDKEGRNLYITGGAFKIREEGIIG